MLVTPRGSCNITVYMTIFNRKTALLLLVGDCVVFIASLWFTLFLRYGEVPREAFFRAHLEPFSLLFVVWILIFFIAGLYDKQTVLFKSKLPKLLTEVQVINILIAIIFFYFIPWYGISPKTTLFLYLLISLFLVLAWRVYGYIAIVPTVREQALVIGGGEEIRELVTVLNQHKEYNIDVVSEIDPSTPGAREQIGDTFPKGITLCAVDLYNDKVQSVLPKLYNLIFSRIRFMSVNDIYESVFYRIPSSLVKHSWFLENISTSPKVLYDVLKRIMDISIAGSLGVISLIVYPFVAILIKLEDGGPVFIFQERIGKNNRSIRIAKFRSMSVYAQDATGASRPQEVTKIGAFIRKTRIDELPQLWNVVMGSISLIGPRPELPQFVRQYEAEIPFYKIRHLIKPGLSGWAQIYHTTPPKFVASREDTAKKLSYDLFYIKNRSFLLDISIALKTIKELVSRKGV